MKQEVVTDDQKMVGAGVCKKRTIHDMNQPQRMGPSPTSHAELRDPGGGVFGCTKGASTGHEPDELVEVRLCRIFVSTLILIFSVVFLLMLLTLLKNLSLVTLFM